MDTRLTSTMALLVVLTLAACGGKSGDSVTSSGGSAGDPEAIARGQQVYNRACALCHGGDANGKPGLGQSLRDNAFSKGLGDAELAEFIRVGRAADDPLNELGVAMPPMGGDPSMTDQELEDLVAYLRTL